MHDADKQRILELLDSVGDMTLATVRADGYPQATTVSYVNEGLTIYFGTASDSQKARNIARDPKVSLTVNRPYRFWKDILGLSAGGLASAVTEPEEYRRASALLFARFPEVAVYKGLESQETVLFRIEPTAIALLDYRHGIGHVFRLELDASA